MTTNTLNMKYLFLTICLLPFVASIQPSEYTFLDTKPQYQIETSYHGSIASQYQPQHLLGAQSPHGLGNDQCELYKVGFLQDLYFQYIQYKTEVPKMKEFTLCMWTKFTNHSNDHPLFSYACKY